MDFSDFLKRGALTVNLNVCISGTEGAALGQVLKAIDALGAKVVLMAAAIDRVETELGELTSAGDAMALLLETLATEIRAGANSEARMNALADKMDEKEQAWIAAALRNTPADPELPPDPPPGEEGV